MRIGHAHDHHLQGEGEVPYQERCRIIGICQKLFTAFLEDAPKRLDLEKSGIQLSGEYLGHLKYAHDNILFSMP